MRAVQAWERLNDPEYAGRLDMEQMYELVLRAGYGEEEARKAAQQRGWDRLQAGVKM